MSAALPPAATAIPKEDATTTSDEEKKSKKVNPTVAKVKMLSYITSTKPRFRKFKENGTAMNPYFVGNEVDKLLASIQRHGRDTQLSSLKIPMECFVEMMGFLPPPGCQSGHSTAVLKMMRVSTMTLFTVMENDWVKHPKKAPVLPILYPPMPVVSEKELTEAEQQEQQLLKVGVMMDEIMRDLRGPDAIDDLVGFKEEMDFKRAAKNAKKNRRWL